MDRIHVMVPVFNEEPNIGTLFEAFRGLARELGGREVHFLLVDDGSSDGTVAAARAAAAGLDLTVLEHGTNRGPGAAFATAFAHFAHVIDERDWVITLEGDNTSRQELILRMLERAEREGFDVVLASPYMYGGGIKKTSFLRKFLSGGANLVVKDLLDIQGILTVSSFFRLYRGSALLRLQRVFGPGIVERVGFESMVEMVMKMVMLQLSITEIAMTLDSSLRKGKSKMKVVRTIFGYLALWRCKGAWAARLPSQNLQ